MRLQQSFIILASGFAFCGTLFAQQDDKLDVTFNPGSVNNYVFAIALTGDGNVMLGGAFTSINGQSRNGVARLHSDGTLDTSFVPGAGPENDVLAVESEPGGMSYIGGSFDAVNGILRARFARLRIDGSLDLAWPSILFDDVVNFIQRQGDGTLLVLGKFTHVGAVKRQNVAKINTDASLDPHLE
jgi:hypothetical protein